MSDNKSIRGERDRNKVAAEEKYELTYLAAKLKVPIEKVEAAIKVVGNDRQKIEEYISRAK